MAKVRVGGPFSFRKEEDPLRLQGAWMGSVRFIRC